MTLSEYMPEHFFSVEIALTLTDGQEIVTVLLASMKGFVWSISESWHPK